jgi:hypothetical protein
MCGTIKRNIKNKTRRNPDYKFFKVMAVSPGPYGSENWVLRER